MGASQPFMYTARQHGDVRFPTTSFDPKAVTRASWEPKPKKPQMDGPLVSLNRHPDAHLILPHRANQHAPLASRTKSWIKWLRRFQLLLRCLQLIGSLGLLVVFQLIKMGDILNWTMRISLIVIAIHCAYAVYHLSRGAAGRTPASSAAYSLFAIVLDSGTIAVYIFGVLKVHHNSADWSLILDDRSSKSTLMLGIYYAMVGLSGLHLLSLSNSLWLGWIFRKISLMPPDMNPLEDHLTARPFHKRNKSSMSTATTVFETNFKTFSSPGSRPSSWQTFEKESRPSTVSFMDTRTQSRDSIGSRDSKVNLPSRQYQVTPSNSPRTSVMPTPPRHNAVLPATRSSYAEVPSSEPLPSEQDVAPQSSNNSRTAKFTETWMPTNSIISRTNERNRALLKSAGDFRSQKRKTYAALATREDIEDYSSDSTFEEMEDDFNPDLDLDWDNSAHPNPLRSHPTSPQSNVDPMIPRPLRPWSVSGPLASRDLSEVNMSERYASHGEDIHDQSVVVGTSTRERMSSIQPEVFYAVPYAHARSATPPIIIGDNRKVSTGNDFASQYASRPYERRNVSGKIAEEGRMRGAFASEVFH